MGPSMGWGSCPETSSVGDVRESSSSSGEASVGDAEDRADVVGRRRSLRRFNGGIAGGEHEGRDHDYGKDSTHSPRLDCRP